MQIIHPGMQARGTIHLWLTGGVLLALWLLAFLFAAATLGSCGTDCGDNGGRAAFIGLVATAPLGAVGLTLFVLGAGGARGLLRPMAWLAIGSGALVALVAVVVAVHAVDQLIDSVTGSDIHLVGQEDYERERMRKDAPASAIVAVVLAPVAASGLLPTLAGRVGEGARRWARVVLAALALFYVAFVLMAAVTADADLLPCALVGLVTAAGASLALAELRRPAY